MNETYNILPELNENISPTCFLSPYCSEISPLSFRTSPIYTSSPTPKRGDISRRFSGRLESPKQTSFVSHNGELYDGQQKPLTISRLPISIHQSQHKKTIESDSPLRFQAKCLSALRATQDSPFCIQNMRVGTPTKNANRMPLLETCHTSKTNLQTEASEASRIRCRTIWKDEAMRIWKEEDIAKQKSLLVVTRTPECSSQKKGHSKKHETLHFSVEKLREKTTNGIGTPVRHPLIESERDIVVAQSLFRTPNSSVPLKPLSSLGMRRYVDDNVREVKCIPYSGNSLTRGPPRAYNKMKANEHPPASAKCQLTGRIPPIKTYWSELIQKEAFGARPSHSAGISTTTPIHKSLRPCLKRNGDVNTSRCNLGVNFDL